MVSSDSLGILPLRRIACVGRLLKDHKLPDGRHFIRVHGVCRAEMSRREPEGDRLFQSLSKPVGQCITSIPDGCRSRLHDLLTGERLVRMRLADEVRGYLEKDDISLETVVEIASFVLVQDESIRYRLLAERILQQGFDPLRGTRASDQLVELCDLQTVEGLAQGAQLN